MTERSWKRSRHHLKHLVEAVVAEEFDLPRRGLAFLVDEIDVIGRPPKQLRVWATLHFLPTGSPFCCIEPTCHVPLFARSLDRVNDSLRHRMQLRHEVFVDVAAFTSVPHRGVEFDDPLAQTTSIFKGPSDIDRRDALGRTSLMRAAVRGYDHEVEKLLAEGADPTIIDNRGRGILEQVSSGRCWIVAMIEEALAKRGKK